MPFRNSWDMTFQCIESHNIWPCKLASPHRHSSILLPVIWRLPKECPIDHTPIWHSSLWFHIPSECTHFNCTHPISTVPRDQRESWSYKRDFLRHYEIAAPINHWWRQMNVTADIYYKCSLFCFGFRFIYSSHVQEMVAGFVHNVSGYCSAISMKYKRIGCIYLQTVIL